ncbi:MAG: DUF4347 domain-containing protein [Sedimentisphaerales bacterium]|nr:DUF4347 domain-containing protein [Sedimentisphaerales bacterium]
MSVDGDAVVEDGKVEDVDSIDESKETSGDVNLHEKDSTQKRHNLSIVSDVPYVSIDNETALTEMVRITVNEPSTNTSIIPVKDGSISIDRTDVYSGIESFSSIDIRGPPAPTQATYQNHIVFVDSTLDREFQTENAFHPGVGVKVLPSNSNGIQYISDILSSYEDLSAIHIISHGMPGQVSLGTTVLDLTTLQAHTADLSAWGESLTPWGDILFYGCSIAQGDNGSTLIDQIAQITGADVAASTDNTGPQQKGGDWILEYHTGPLNIEVNTELPFLAFCHLNVNHWRDFPLLAINTRQTDSTENTLNDTVMILQDEQGNEYFADQMIVKLRDDPSLLLNQVPASSASTRSLQADESPSLQSLFDSWSVANTQSSFAEFNDSYKTLTTSPTDIVIEYDKFEDLGKVFQVQLPMNTDLRAAITAFSNAPEVEYAEPVYVYRLDMIPNDPQFNQQWYLHNTGQYDLADADVDAPEAWDIDPGTTHPIIAIIDTGVDLDHPDLDDHIWHNVDEQVGDANNDGAPGFAGFDDDGDGLIDEDSEGRQPGEPGYSNDLVDDDDENGYIDDFFGWNWIDGNNNPQDDHGHGTHCAGIAAAETNNGIGIAGMCPNAQIMALKAFQATGTASNADIAQAIEYAYQNGADVISMSFGGPESSLIRDALELAYSRCVLVAAAGNGGEREGLRYPAQYPYVIGVGATDIQWNRDSGSYEEVIASFTNTKNADIYAPGVNIRSTLLDDTYASWTGTSMATPIVAGIAGLVVSEYSGGFWNSDLYQAQLLNAGETQVQKRIQSLVLAVGDRISSELALTSTPEPNLSLESYVIDDSRGDGDGLADAGEIVDIYLTIRNIYGNATDVTATLSTTDAMATVIDGNADYGTIGPQASDDNTGDPITVQISPDAGNLRDIVFNFQAHAGNGGTGIDESVVLTVQRGTEVSGVIESDTTWTSENLYIVTGNLLVEEGVTLTIEPGTTIQFDGPDKLVGMMVRGTLDAQGLPGQMITFTANGQNPFPGWWHGVELDDSGFIKLRYCTIEYTGMGGSGLRAVDDPEGRLEVDYCILQYNWHAINIRNLGQVSHIRNCLIIENEYTGIHDFVLWPNYRPQFIFEDNLVAYTGSESGFNIEQIPEDRSTYNIKNNTFMGNQLYNVKALVQYHGTVDTYNVDFTNNYWGTTDPEIIAENISDYYDNFISYRVDFEPFLSAPSPNSPPILLDVELDVVSPVGAGALTFTLTFSKAMDTTRAPTVSFGLQEPYTQHMVGGDWIDDRTWEGIYNITLFTGDGLHTLRVADARDPETLFEIPKDTRFSFRIGTAGLSGVNVQASGEVGRVDLYFNPVDEPDLAGYNIYRSDGSGGPYIKLNSAVVLESQYSDYTAPEGIPQYYVVTAVRTDFSESDYSDEASAAAQDWTPPTILHTPIVDHDIKSTPGITVQATITDVGIGVSSATLFYKHSSESTYNSAVMTNASGKVWSANIPESSVDFDGIDYYIAAEDYSGYSATGFNGTDIAPHLIIVYSDMFGPVWVPAGASVQSFGSMDVSIEFLSNETAGELTVYRLDTAAPNTALPILQKHWVIQGLEPSTFSAHLTFTYTDQSLADGYLDEASLILRKSSDSAAYLDVAVLADPIANTITTAHPQTSFSIWTIGDTLVRPTIESLSPTDDMIEVPLDTELVMDFSETVQPGMGYITLKRSNDGAIIERIDINSDQVLILNDIVTIHPTVTLAEGTDYCIQIEHGALENQYGVPYIGISDGTTWNFSTILDSGPYIAVELIALATTSDSDIITTLPNSLTEVVKGNPYVIEIWLQQLIGSEGIQGGSVNLRLTPNDQAAFLRIDHGGLYTLLTDGSLQALDLIQDISGATMAGHMGLAPTWVRLATVEMLATGDQLITYTLEYSIHPFGLSGIGNVPWTKLALSTLDLMNIDTTAPSVVGFSPADEAMDVAIDTNLTINFDETVQKGTGNIVIKQANDDFIVETINVNSPQVTVFGSQVTIDPTSELSSLTDCYVQISNGAIQYPSGNGFLGINDDTTWNFRTVEIHPPTDMDLSNQNLLENQLVGTLVGELTTADQTVGSPHTYSLVSGFGDSDNESFMIVADQILTNEVFDYEAKHQYSIRVRTTNMGGLEFEKVFIITITDMNEPPTVYLANTVTTISEDIDTSSAIKVADIVITDDALGTNTLGLSDDDASLFEIAGESLIIRAGASIDYETNPQLDVTVEVDDSAIDPTPDDTASLVLIVIDVVEALTITTESDLPVAGLDHDYSVLIEAIGGVMPYTWSIESSNVGEDYQESDPGPGSVGDGTAMGWQNDDASYELSLPWTFPFYSMAYSSVWVSTNGFLDFTSSRDDNSNSQTELINSVRIAALWDDLVTTEGDIYVNTTDPNAITIRWEGYTYESNGDDMVDFMVTLYREGTIRFDFGVGNIDLTPTIGISAGDGIHYTLSSRDGVSEIPANVASLFERVCEPLPNGLFLDETTGQISGVPTELSVFEFQILVTDSDTPENKTSKVFTLEVVETPVIEVLGNGQLIPDGDTIPSISDDTDFGSVNVVAGSMTHILTFSNVDSAALYQ